MPTPTRILLFVALLLVPIEAVTLWAQEEAVSVVVKKQARPGGSVAYQYTVINNSKQTIATVWIGFTFGGQDMELDLPPLGWEGLGSPIPAGNSSSPAHWKPMVVTQEGSAKVSIKWENDGQAHIKPGQTLTGFAVVTEKASDTYLSSHWTATVTGGKPASGVLKPAK